MSFNRTFSGRCSWNPKERGGGIGEGQAGIGVLFPVRVWLTHSCVDAAPHNGVAGLVTPGQQGRAVLDADRQTVCGDTLVELLHHGLGDFRGATDDLLGHGFFDLLVNTLHQPLPPSSHHTRPP
jgi:hypothetical protein